MSANEDQPRPADVTEASGAAVWDIILADQSLPEWLRRDIEERDAIGLDRYGQRLRVHNGRSSLKDAYQEALDLWVYLYQSLSRALSRMGQPGERTAQTLLLANGLAHRVGQAREIVLWLGPLVHSGMELP